MDTEKRLQELVSRLTYIQDIFGHRDNHNLNVLRTKVTEYQTREKTLDLRGQVAELSALEDLFDFLEKKLEAELTPMDKVRIVRHPQRICLRDILENVYDNYTEIGGQDEWSIDPAMLIARAYITRRIGNKVVNQPVMVIGQEKGHGQEFRNGGSVKPWGNSNALRYMQVAETENIPIHTWVFTPGAFPVEDYPGAAQQIARNLYEMAGLTVPIVSVISEGGSGGAEAIALSDVRLMLSHGYYSVISPEGAAAIEGRLKEGGRATPELIEKCARQLKITADDNLANGLIDRVVREPRLGARPHHYDFFKTLRQEVIQATDKVVLGLRGFKFFRTLVVDSDKPADAIYVRWSLTPEERSKLVWKRYKKFRKMASKAFVDNRTTGTRIRAKLHAAAWSLYSFLRYDLFKKHQKKLNRMVDEIEAEAHVVVGTLLRPLTRIKEKLALNLPSDKTAALTRLSRWDDGKSGLGDRVYLSPQALQDRTVSCPNADKHGCLDQWAPDLFHEWAGVCSFCGHHFPMEYEWYLYNVFDLGSVFEFGQEIEAGNPLGFEGFELKLDEAKKKTRNKSSCMTFEARIKGVKMVVAMLTGNFRGGSVGAAEGEKFIRAADRARRKHFPFLAYVHGTAGIRIQEGTCGVIQMPRCTLAVRRYIEAGGLYVVVYDTNSYAGPVASFLGCSPYQFALRSANLGFAGPGVIRETTGVDIPPDYHRSHRALSRGHIQGIWDRREMRRNLYQAMLTIGGRNIYYR